MYTYSNALQYIAGEWQYLNLANTTINDIINQTRYTLVNVTDHTGKYYYIDREILLSAADRKVTLAEHLTNLGALLPELNKPIDIVSSSYKDLTGTMKRGSDYILTKDIPFVINPLGISEVNSQVVLNLANRLESLGNYALGYLDVGLPYIKRHLTLKDFATNSSNLKAVVDYSNSFFVVGNSLIKLSTLFDDRGSYFKLRDGYHKFMVDLYVDNLQCIPPTSIGVSGNSISKETLLRPETLKRLFCHHTVYVVTYECDFPLGDTYIDVVNEWIDDYYDYLITYNNKPSNNVVIHQRYGYAVRDMMVTEAVRHYNDNHLIVLAVSDEIQVRRTPRLYAIEYPLVDLA